MRWKTLKDKSEVLLNGRNRVLRIFKRPHGGYACFVFKNGVLVATNGYYATALPQKYNAVRWGISKATKLKIIDGYLYK